MIIEQGIAKHNFLLHSIDVDPYYIARLEAYFNMMQEAAGMHAFHLGIGIPQLREEKKTWVVTRTQMNIYKWASWPTTIDVETWPQLPYRLYYPRGCRGYSETSHDLLFESMTLWLIIDSETFRIMKPDDSYNNLLGKSERQVDPAMKKRLSFIPENYKVVEKNKIKIQYHHTDSNFHVNNVVYLQWMISTLPFPLLDMYQPSFVDISYLKQAFRDDPLLSYTGYGADYSLDADEFTLYHNIVKVEENGEESALCFATTTWKKRELF
ncbi:MAG: hypothetical protein EOM67_07720 [Spirochaetia bacterium]|nr:hypothetical protein [Spirochaetia bacterium]